MVANTFLASSDAALEALVSLEALVLSAVIVGPTAIAASKVTAGTDDALAVLEPTCMFLVVLGSTESMVGIGVGVGLGSC